MGKILIIEDDSSVRQNIVDLLSEEGYQIYEAGDGFTGIELAKKYLPNLIISDIMMPSIDGYGVLEELHKFKSTQAIPFIFLSAQADKIDVRQGMNAGADDYLTKPYKAEDLLNAIKSRLKKCEELNQKVNNALDSISISLPHEFRTPLIPVMAYSQILHEESSNLNLEEISEMAKDINTAGKSLLKLIQKFLIFSHLEKAAASITELPELRQLSINSAKDILKHVLYDLTFESNRKSDLQIDFEDASLEIEEEHFGFLLTEIIENAIKFSEPGSPILINGAVTENQFLCEIKDFGTGINSDQIPEIGALRQFDREEKCQRGVGLGLAIAKKIAEIYGLNIHIDSVLKKYTSVKIYIPLKNAGAK